MLKPDYSPIYSSVKCNPSPHLYEGFFLSTAFVPLSRILLDNSTQARNQKTNNPRNLSTKIREGSNRGGSNQSTSHGILNGRQSGFVTNKLTNRSKHFINPNNIKENNKGRVQLLISNGSVTRYPTEFLLLKTQ